MDILDSCMPDNEQELVVIRIAFDDVIRDQANDYIAGYIIHFHETGRYYIGSSSKLKYRLNRHRSLLRSGTHVNKRLQAEYRDESKVSVFVFPQKTLEAARDFEQRLLDKHHGLDQCLNIGSDVRAPVHGYDRSHVYLATKERMNSEAGRVINSERMRQRWQDPAHRENFLAKVGESIVVDDIRYASVREASRATGFSINALRNSLKDGVVLTTDIKPFKRKVMAEGVVYDSLKQAGDAYGIRDNSMHHRCNSNAPKWANFYYA